MRSVVICCIVAFALISSSATVKAHPEMPVRVRYLDWDGWLLTDGRLEAIVVPELGGRLLCFRFAGGANVLWNKASTKENAKKLAEVGGYVDWGGDMMWLAPMSGWKEWLGRDWPPDPAWDSSPHMASVETGRLTTVSPASTSGLRMTRSYHFEKGDLVITQTVENRGARPLTVSIWNITRVPWPTEVLIPSWRDGKGEGFVWLSPARPEEALSRRNDAVLAFRPLEGNQFKIGANPYRPAIAAVLSDCLLLEYADAKEGIYPDGPPGCSVELYSDAGTGGKFVELELLSPTNMLQPGKSFVHVIRWNLLRLGADDESPDRRFLEHIRREENP